MNCPRGEQKRYVGSKISPAAFKGYTMLGYIKAALILMGPLAVIFAGTAAMTVLAVINMLF
jgi:hypothetical protein